jgi:hypothetical protein
VARACVARSVIFFLFLDHGKTPLGRGGVVIDRIYAHDKRMLYIIPWATANPLSVSTFFFSSALVGLGIMIVDSRVQRCSTRSGWVCKV